MENFKYLSAFELGAIENTQTDVVRTFFQNFLKLYANFIFPTAQRTFMYCQVINKLNI